MINRIILLKVKYIPKDFELGKLYFSKKYGVAGHLCPCGCGNRIITPIDETEWSITIKKGRPTLYPSIGNWQLSCKSHYWITNGEIKWSYKWTDEQIMAGQQAEEERKKSYYNNLEHNRNKQSTFKYIFKRLFRN